MDLVWGVSPRSRNFLASKAIVGCGRIFSVSCGQGQRQGGGVDELAIGPDGSGGLGCIEHLGLADPVMDQKTEIAAI